MTTRCWVTIVALAYSMASLAKTVTVDIDSQPMEGALNAFAQQAGVQLLMRADAVGGMTAPRLVGTFDLEEALGRLLVNTPLTYKFIDAGTVAIRSADKRSSANRSDANEGTLRLAQAESAPAAQEQTLTPASGENADDSAELQEVVVTAQKRLQRLQDVPAGISVVTGQMIENMGAQSVRDFLQLTPGVSLDRSGEVGNQIQMRGINAQTGAASVGFYIDDLPFSFLNLNILPDPSPYDLETVQVLRGPQGTLYGAGTAGGVILVRTADPTFNDFSGKIDVSSGATRSGDQSYSGSGALNVPLVDDKLALRVAVSYQDNGGWIDDTLESTRKDLNREQRLNARAKLRAQLTDRLSLSVIGVASRIDRDLAADVADNNGDYPEAFFGYRAKGKEDYNQYGAVVTYDFEHFQLRNSASYIDYDAPFAFPYVADLPLLYSTHISTDELRASSTVEGRFNWVTGAYYRRASQVVFQDFSSIALGFNNDDHAHSDQYSLFGDATYELVEHRLDLGVGASYFSDDTRNRANLAPAEPDPVITKVKTRRFSPQVSLSYHPTQDTTLYARYAEGFRAATFDFSLSTYFARFVVPDATGAVDPEDITSYELGAKAAFLDGRLHAELAAFHNKTDDVQQSASIVNASTNVAATTILNAGSAKSDGVELSVAWHPTESFSLQLSGAYVDARIAKDFFAPGTDPSITPPLFEKGAPIFLVPDLTFGFNASYGWPLTAKLNATLSGNAQYSSERSFSLLGAAAAVGDDILITDVRFEVGVPDRWSVYVFGNNLANEDGVVTPNPYTASFVDSGAPIAGSLGNRPRPRTLGIGVRMQF